MTIKNIIYTTILLTFNFIFSISYYNEIQPIFNTHCVECHTGGQFASGGLELINYEKLMEGGDSGNVVIEYDSQNSLLWIRIENGDMPMQASSLEENQITLIADWIDEGARVCDNGFIYHPEVADGLETEYTNVTIQDIEYNPCFYESDVQALQDIITVNDFEYTDNPFKLGTQTWKEGRLRFLVAGYYNSGVEEPIHTLPESIGNLDDLRQLYLEWNHIETLPDSFTNLTALVQLFISNNRLSSLPEDIGDLQSLYLLDLGYNELTSLPDSIVNLPLLTYLWLFSNQLTTLPANFCDLNLNWSDNDPGEYPYFAIGDNQLCDNVPECVANSDKFNTALEQYYYSTQITVFHCCCIETIDDEEICNNNPDSPLYNEEFGICDCNSNLLDCAGACGGTATEDCTGECGGECSECNENNECLNLKESNILFNLSEPYPNPFNPETTINYSINNTSNIKINIYDINGQLIQQLVNQIHTPDEYNITWDATEHTSGIYIVQLIVNDFMQTKKIILIK